MRTVRIRWIRGACTLLVASVAFSALFALYTYSNDFPLYWQPDEPGKVAQIQNLQFNFKHPQLMLSATIAAKHLLGIGNGAVEIGHLGRAVSAAAAALAVLLLALFTYRRHGAGAGLTTLILLGLSPGIFITAHHFKEDTSLLFGIAAALVACQQVERRPTMINIALLSVAVSFAACGKYIGIVMIIPAFVVLITSDVRSWGYLLAGLSFVGGCLAWNIPAISSPNQMIAGLSSEITHLTTDHNGIITGLWSPIALIYMWMSEPATLLGLSIVYFLMVLLRRESRPVTDYVVAVFPLVFLLLVQISIVKFPRYLLPAIALSIVGATCASAEMIKAARTRFTRMLAALPVIAAVGSTAVMFVVTVVAFFDESRDRLAQWLRAELPENAVLIADSYAGLPTIERMTLDPSRPALPQRVLSHYTNNAGSVGTAGSVGALCSEGVTHVVVASLNFDRYFRPDNTLLTAEAQKIKEFYTELFAGSAPLVVFKATPFSELFFSPELVSKFRSPELRVYELSPECSTSGRRTVSTVP